MTDLAYLYAIPHVKELFPPRVQQLIIAQLQGVSARLKENANQFDKNTPSDSYSSIYSHEKYTHHLKTTMLKMM